MSTQHQEYVQSTFHALTDAIIPKSYQLGYEPRFDPQNMMVHEYVIHSLNHYISIQRQLHNSIFPLAYSTAIMLDGAATQLVNARLVQPAPHSPFPKGHMFSHLSKKDRIRTLSALENIHIDLYLLPSPFQNNAGFIKYVVDALNRFSMFCYYSEWSAYGSTRLFPPDYRRLEFFPLSWQQVGYPGISLGYRDFRGFLLTMAEVKK